FIKKFLCYRWFMLALVQLAVELERAVVERIAEYHLDIGNRQPLSIPAQQIKQINLPGSLRLNILLLCGFPINRDVLYLSERFGVRDLIQDKVTICCACFQAM
ncbi:MAG: hypothetical protein AAB889_02510, partial [Patescibacteria group bacterium]